MFGAALVPLSQAAMLDIYPIEPRGWGDFDLGHGYYYDRTHGAAHGYLHVAMGLFINLPVGIAAVLGPRVHGRSPRENHSRSFDWFGQHHHRPLQLVLERAEQLGRFDAQETALEALISAPHFTFFAHVLTTSRPFTSGRAKTLLTDAAR